MANHQDNYTSNFEGQDPAGDAGLSLFLNGAEYTYRPSGPDTSVYIPTTERVDSSGVSINTTIGRILAANGCPILVYHNEEYQYITTEGTPSKYVFMCLADLSTFKRAEVDVATGAVAVSSSRSAAVQYIGRSSHNIFNKISNAIVQNTLPVIVDDSAYYQLSYAWNGMTRFTRVDEKDGTLHILSIDNDDTITETTYELRDVVVISVIGGGSYVSHTDYEKATAGIADNRVVLLKLGSASVTSYSQLIAVGSIGLRFIGVTNDKVRLTTVAPTETPDGHAVRNEYLASDGFTDIVDFDFTDYTESVGGNIAYPIENNKMQVQSDWDGGLNMQASFIAPSDTANNAVIRLENVHTSITWNVQIWNNSKTSLLTLVPGSVSEFEEGASYVIYLYGDKAYVSQVVNKDAAPVTEDELQEAITTLRSRTVFVMDAGEIAGQVNLNTNGTAGFIGTLFSPYMDFDLSANTSVVFDVEQMGNQGDMTSFVLAIYEFDASTGEFNWVANTGDLATQLDSTDRRLGLHHAKLQYLKQNAKLLGGKIYYAVACGRWNGWAFAGNTFATTLHSSVTPAFQCDNRSTTVDAATLGTGSYAKLYATDQSDPTKVDYAGISGNRLFAAFTNVTLSI